MNGTGTTIYDSTGNRDATKDGVSNPTQAIGKVGYGQDFELSNEDKAEAAKLNYVAKQTVEAWYDPESDIDDHHIIVEHCEDATNGYGSTSWKLTRHYNTLKWYGTDGSTWMYSVAETGTFDTMSYCVGTVSYTHLTLPTN